MAASAGKLFQLLVEGPAQGIYVMAATSYEALNGQIATLPQALLNLAEVPDVVEYTRQAFSYFKSRAVFMAPDEADSEGVWGSDAAFNLDGYGDMLLDVAGKQELRLRSFQTDPTQVAECAEFLNKLLAADQDGANSATSSNLLTDTDFEAKEDEVEEAANDDSLDAAELAELDLAAAPVPTLLVEQSGNDRKKVEQSTLSTIVVIDAEEANEREKEVGDAGLQPQPETEAVEEDCKQSKAETLEPLTAVVIRASELADSARPIGNIAAENQALHTSSPTNTTVAELERLKLSEEKAVSITAQELLVNAETTEETATETDELRRANTTARLRDIRTKLAQIRWQLYMEGLLQPTLCLHLLHGFTLSFSLMPATQSSGFGQPFRPASPNELTMYAHLLEHGLSFKLLAEFQLIQPGFSSSTIYTVSDLEALDGVLAEQVARQAQVAVADAEGRRTAVPPANYSSSSAKKYTAQAAREIARSLCYDLLYGFEGDDFIKKFWPSELEIIAYLALHPGKQKREDLVSQLLARPTLPQ